MTPTVSHHTSNSNVLWVLMTCCVNIYFKPTIRGFAPAFMLPQASTPCNPVLTTYPSPFCKQADPAIGVCKQPNSIGPHNILRPPYFDSPLHFLLIVHDRPALNLELCLSKFIYPHWLWVFNTLPIYKKVKKRISTQMIFLPFQNQPIIFIISSYKKLIFN